MHTDKAWERYGATEPYFGVLAEPRFQGKTLAEQERTAFFQSGEEHIERVFSIIRSSLVPGFSPQRALDFGCGVGRLVLPLARRVAEVVGVDVSASMIAEAKRNAADLTNITLLQSDERRHTITGLFDFIHAFIVFQHIPPSTGLRYVHGLLGHLQPGGVGALHFVYDVHKPLWKRAIHWARKTVPGLQMLANIAQGYPARRPFMQMNPYPPERLFRMLHESGCHRITVRFTDHGGFLGVMLFFQKVSEPSL